MEAKRADVIVEFECTCFLILVFVTVLREIGPSISAGGVSDLYHKRGTAMTESFRGYK